MIGWQAEWKGHLSFWHFRLAQPDDHTEQGLSSESWNTGTPQSGAAGCEDMPRKPLDEPTEPERGLVENIKDVMYDVWHLWETE